MRTAFTILTLTLLVLVAPGRAEEEEERESAPARPSASFPESWRGVWRGTCRTGARGRPGLEFPMELHVEPREGGAWSWTIVYGEGEKRQVRPYEIQPVDPATGHWRVDEKNGIFIDAFHVDDVDDTLYSRFEVMGSCIEVRYRRSDAGLHVLLTTFGAKAHTTSGGEGRIPPVASFELKGVQRGLLTRQEAD